MEHDIWPIANSTVFLDPDFLKDVEILAIRPQYRSYAKLYAGEADKSGDGWRWLVDIGNCC